MTTHNRHKTIRNTVCATAAGLGMTLLVGLAGAQEVAGGGATTATDRDHSAYKGAMKEMPRLKEAGVVTVKGNENWDKTLGFGKDSNMMEMMTLMMVGGSGMEHMKMAGMSSTMHMGSSGEMETGDSDSKGMAMDAAQGLPTTVTLKQNPPVAGDNMLDVVVTDAGGKPVTGLKLAATVAMTSMDMGTEHPKLVEGKDGHYSVPVKFSMKGPWRVMLMNDGKANKSAAVHTILDFNVDGKTKWTQPKPMAGMKMQAGTKAPADDMAGMKMPAKGEPGTKAPAADTITTKTPAVDTTATKTPTANAAAANPAIAEAVGTKTPVKGVASATMPAGDMAGMKMPATGAASGVWKVTVNTDAKTLAVGKNMLDVTILDSAGKPVTGAKVMGSVEMTSMDMGVTKPKVQEGKDGHYTVPVQFSMKGPWRVTLTVTPPKQKPFTKALDFTIPK
jgi:hypothetical protein